MGVRNGGGGGQKRKRRFELRFRRTKRRYSTAKQNRDIDQIQDEIIKIKRGIAKPEAPDIEKPGMGQFKCIICARYFINENVLKQHKRTKKHKKMFRKVSRPQYTQKEADKCAGLGRDDNEIPSKRKKSNVTLLTMDQ